MKMWKYYLQAVGYPSLFILLFSFIYTLLYANNGIDTANSSLVIGNVVPTAIFAVVMSIFALPIFLNRIKRFSNSLPFNLLTWFLLPGVYLLIVLINDAATRAKYGFGFGDDFFYLLFLILPFPAGLILTFLKYRKNLLVTVAGPSESTTTEGEEVSKTQSMSRRRFVGLTLAGAATAGAGAFLVHSFNLAGSKILLEELQPQIPFDSKKIFHRCGACSNALFTALNKIYGYPSPLFEIATDPLAGGLYNSQNQCGMLWGATMALGAQSLRTCEDPNMAAGMAMDGARDLIQSFKNRTGTANCRDIMGFDWEKPNELMAFMLPALPNGYLNMTCFNLVEKWVPEAYGSVKKSTESPLREYQTVPKSCASEVVRRMGGSEEQAALVAGFAGGIGFSGNACGALGAAIWMNTVAWCRDNPGQTGYLNPRSKEIMATFLEATESKITCEELSKQHFTSVENHTDFINNGGCDHLINLLAEKAA